MKEKKTAVGTALVGTKGQIVIPQEIRTMFGIEPGDTLIVLADKKKGIALVKSEFVAALAERGMAEEYE